MEIGKVKNCMLTILNELYLLMINVLICGIDLMNSLDLLRQ